MKKTEKKENLIYDVGLNRGQDTDFYLKSGYNVIAFEAAPENIEFCKRRFADAIADGRLIIVEGAITESTEENVKFYRNIDHSLWGSVCEDWAYRNEVMGTNNEVIQVKAVDFGKCLEKFGIPFYIKADIVGSEKICLRALIAFENKPDYLSIRSEKVIFKRLKEEFELLQQLGYNRFKAVQQAVLNAQTKIKKDDNTFETYTFEEGASGVLGEDAKGKWLTFEQVKKKYQKIFTMYWLFGDYSYLIQTKKGKRFIYLMERLLRRPLPGWYDTHAKHSSSLLSIFTMLNLPGLNLV